MRRTLGWLIAGLLLVADLTACGGDDGDNGGDDALSGSSTCTDWDSASGDERDQAVADLGYNPGMAVEIVTFFCDDLRATFGDDEADDATVEDALAGLDPNTPLLTLPASTTTP